MSASNITRVLYIIGFLDLFAVSLVIPLVSKHARDIGASPSVAGMIGSIYGGLQLFSSPVIGGWSDVSGRRFVLICCTLLAAVGYFLLGLSTTILLIALARVPSGIFKHTQELLRGYLAEITPVKDHSRVFGNLNAAASVGFIIGPILSGHVAETPGGFHVAAVVTTVMFLLNVGMFKHTQNIIKARLSDKVSRLGFSDVQGRYNALSSLGFVLGPLVSGHIMETVNGFQVTCLIATTLFVLNSAIVWYYVPDDCHASQQQRNASRIDVSPLALLSRFREISWRDMWSIFLVRFFMGFAVLIYRSNFVMMLDYKYQAGVVVSGYITSYSGVVGTLSGFIVGRIAHFYQNDSKLLLHSGIVQFLSMLMVTFSPSLFTLIIASTPLSLANQVARVCATNLTIHKGHGQEKGTLLGMGGSILAFARMLSPTIGGFAQEYHTSGPSLVGSVFAGAAVITMIFTFDISDSYSSKNIFN